VTRATTNLLALNRGLMSRLGRARIDLKRTALAAQQMTNWIPRVLGPMSLRPGFEYIGSSASNSKARLLPFVFASDDTALLELTDGLLRVWVNDALVSRATVATAIINGAFDTDLTGWTDSDESGAASTWAFGGSMALLGTGTNAAMRDQEVTVAVGDQGVAHGLRIVVNRGPVTLRIGSSSGGEQYVSARTLRTGTHSFSITPTGNFWIRLSNDKLHTSYVDSIAIEGAGVMTLETPWTENDLPEIRYSQSADVVFLAHGSYQQRRIERYDDGSWSIVLYEADAGPFRLMNTTAITITPSALSGDVTLTASKPIFSVEHVGALFRLSSTGQTVQKTITGAAQWSDPIAVTGIGGERRISIIITGTWSATISLQYSVAAPGAWVTAESWTSNQSRTYSDDLDGEIIYYRIGSTAYASGTANATLSIASGSLTGTARITNYSSATSVTARVLDSFGQTTATADWWEGAWSDKRGWPSAVGIYEGRMWWFGKANCWASVSDAYDDFDDNTEGDSGPISRSIGEGPVDKINWTLPMQRLLIGTDGAELSVRSSSFDEPITPTNFSIKYTSTQGSSRVAAARVDSLGFFVQRSGQRVYMLGYELAQSEYVNEDVTALVPDLNEVGITYLTCQRQPDTRIHAVRADGKVAMMVFEKLEDVRAWCLIETDGEIEDACVLPGAGEDDVYYVVKRTVNDVTVRYIEKWAQESQCRGGLLNLQADSFLIYDDEPTSAFGGLEHLEGKTVCIWGDGKDMGTDVVTDGSVSIASAVAQAVIGLVYEGRFQSMKQALAESLIQPLNERARISNLGLVLADTHYQGLEFGPDFDTMDGLPLVENEQASAADTVWESYDEDFVEFPGEWTTDARICLKATAPRPCTVLAVQAIVASNER
jgi:hypothetical protein